LVPGGPPCPHGYLGCWAARSSWSRNRYGIRYIKTNSVALSSQENYTDLATATCRRTLVSTFVDRGVSRGRCGGSPTVVNLSFLDRSCYFPFK
jgi:hypothetical protein